jgi:hypothetical protein
MPSVAIWKCVPLHPNEVVHGVKLGELEKLGKPSGNNDPEIDAKNG